MSSTKLCKPRGMSGQEMLDWMLSSTVTTPSGCMEWQGYRSKGYGRVYYNGKNWRAHRLVMHLQDRLPKGMCALHACDNRPCINPDHLFAGTEADNTADMMSKGRHRLAEVFNPKRGSESNFAKLTEASVLEIVRCARAGEIQKSIANRFGIKQSAVSMIMSGRRWSHITGIEKRTS